MYGVRDRDADNVGSVLGDFEGFGAPDGSRTPKRSARWMGSARGVRKEVKLEGGIRRPKVGREWFLDEGVSRAGKRMRASVSPEMDYSLLSEGTPEPSRRTSRADVTYPFARFEYHPELGESRGKQYYKFFVQKYQWYEQHMLRLPAYACFTLAARVLPVIHFQAKRKERFMTGPIGQRYKKALIALLREKMKFHLMKSYNV